jgi:hypothetical protein
MTQVILTYKLKPGVTREAYESWTRTVDYPAMRGLKRVSSFVNHRVTGLLIGEGEPYCDYVEVFDISDMAGFLAEDMGGPVVQKIMGEFMGFADNPQFLVAEAVV